MQCVLTASQGEAAYGAAWRHAMIIATSTHLVDNRELLDREVKWLENMLENTSKGRTWARDMVARGTPPMLLATRAVLDAMESSKLVLVETVETEEQRRAHAAAQAVVQLMQEWTAAMDRMMSEREFEKYLSEIREMTPALDF